MMLAAALALTMQDGSPPRPYSVIVATWGPSERVRESACRPDEICMDMVEDVRVRIVRTIAGPRVPNGTILRMRLHVPPGRGVRMVLTVQPTTRAPFRRASWLTYARQSEAACVDRSMFTDAQLQAPAGSWEKDGEVCFRI